MAIGQDISKIIKNVDKILTKQGVYSTVTYNEVTKDDSTYDPITGSYGESSSVTHTFQGVVTTESSAGTVQLVILPIQIENLFNLEIDQIFVIDGSSWKIESFETAPIDSVHTVNLKRNRLTSC